MPLLDATVAQTLAQGFSVARRPVATEPGTRAAVAYQAAGNTLPGSLISAAEADTEIKPAIAGLKRCATQNQTQNRFFSSCQRRVWVRCAKYGKVGSTHAGLAIIIDKYRTLMLLVLLTAAALLVHGDHPYAEDAEIYLPGVERILNPQLFPVGQVYFQSHASMTLFPNLIAGSLRLTHIPFETGLFLWHVGSIFLFLLAVWQLSGALFSSERARWGATALLAGLLTLPIAGTGLYLIDQYVNPRNLAGFAAVFATTYLLKRKYLWAFVWVALAASVHPLMWVFPFSFGALWLVLGWIETKIPTSAAKNAAEMGHPTHPGMACFVLLAIPFTQYSPAYHEAAKLHANHYIQNWAWYEWVGIVAPMVLLWWFGRIAQSRQWMQLTRACRAFAIYGLIYLVTAVALDLPARFESLARLQPMRSLYLEYIFLFVCVGGLLGEFVLKNHVWRWLVLFLPMAVGMFLAQRALFPASAHVEWPGTAPRNPWAQAFVWIRESTPVDAVFAMDPWYMHIDGEDNLGFRCMAERSRMADGVKDNGVVSMFPPLADTWWREVQAQTPWKNFQAADFARLKQNYGVGWVVLQRPGVAGMECPYQNSAVIVCRAP